jgi:hypothetical protein
MMRVKSGPSLSVKLSNRLLSMRYEANIYIYLSPVRLSRTLKLTQYKQRAFEQMFINNLQMLYSSA